MALGYEGYVKLHDKYALGTGTAVPRVRSLLESQSGFAGVVSSPVAQIGVGSPHTYDWEVYDGSLSFEITKDIFQVLKAWVLDREGQRTVLFSTRMSNVQQYVDTFWNSISISASEGAALDGSVGFVAVEQDNYAFGFQGLQGYFDNKQGAGLLCPLAT